MFKETETYKKQANRYQYFCLFSNNIDLKNNRNDWKPFWIFCWANSCDKFVSIRSCQTMKLPYTVMKKEPPPMSGLRGGNGSNLPRPPAGRGTPWWNLFVSNKILVSKIPWFRSDTRIQLYILFLCCVKYQGPLTAIDFSTSLTFCQI